MTRYTFEPAAKTDQHGADLSAWAGAEVEITRRLTVAEAHPEVGPMFKIRTQKGFELTAFEDELSEIAEPAPAKVAPAPRYSHQLAIAFTVESANPEGEDIDSDAVKAALARRIADLDSAGELEWKEAVLPPLDSAPLD